MTEEKRVPMTGSDACYTMHVALRKCCDSKPTSALYQVINLICAVEIKPSKLNPWRIVGDWVAKEINAIYDRGVRPGLKQATSIVKDAFKNLPDFYWERIKERRQNSKAAVSDPEHAHEALYAMTCVTALFDPSDWVGMAGYLVDDNEA